jgi:hypothetical protein
MPRPKRVVPFDTGAWASGCYSDFLHPNMQPLQFEVAPEYEEAGRLVAFFFGGNAEYFSGKCRSDIEFSSLEMEVECLKAMLSAPARTTSDDRRGTIEIQIDGSLDLKVSKVLAIVLPSHFMDDNQIRLLCSSLTGVELVPYDTYHARPAEDTRAIMTAVGAFLKKRGYL